MPCHYNNRPSSSHSNHSNCSTGSNRSRGQGQRQPFCSFCKNIGKNPFGHFVRDCIELQSIVCQHCGKNGHTIKYCSFIEKCKFCERVGHTEDKCFYNPANNIPKCKNCGRFGHKYLDCYSLSKEKKEAYLKQIKKRKEEEEEKNKKEQKILEKYSNKGFTYSITSLKTYKKEFNKNSNYVPWIIFCDSESEEEEDCELLKSGLTKKEEMRLYDIKYQISMLEN
jgi:hypothetical protein